MATMIAASRLTADQRPATIGLSATFGLVLLLIVGALLLERTIVHVRPFIIGAVTSNFNLQKAYARSASAAGRHGNAVRATADLATTSRIVPMHDAAVVTAEGTIHGTLSDGPITTATASTTTDQVTTTISTDDANAPDTDFTPVEKEPTFSMEELYRSIRYPEIARARGIEGKVMVKALILASGAIGEVVIVDSENDLLNSAAIDGVRAVHFQPAEQNNRNVPCWVYIPVRFTLR